MWLLNCHRVLCGNALDGAAFAVLMGEECAGLELDPRYVDTTVRRWQELTGACAYHAESGCSFDDHAREVEAANAA
jgi:hypothetical protein